MGEGVWVRVCEGWRLGTLWGREGKREGCDGQYADTHTLTHTPYILMHTFTLILSHPHSYPHTLTLTRMMRKFVEKLWKRNWKMTN